MSQALDLVDIEPQEIVAAPCDQVGFSIYQISMNRHGGKLQLQIKSNFRPVYMATFHPKM